MTQKQQQDRGKAATTGCFLGYWCSVFSTHVVDFWGDLAVETFPAPHMILPAWNLSTYLTMLLFHCAYGCFRAYAVDFSRSSWADVLLCMWWADSQSCLLGGVVPFCRCFLLQCMWYIPRGCCFLLGGLQAAWRLCSVFRAHVVDFRGCTDWQSYLLGVLCHAGYVFLHCMWCFPCGYYFITGFSWFSRGILEILFY